MIGSVEMTRRDGVVTLILHNTAKRNALSMVMLQQLEAAAAALRQDETARCLVLTGAGTAFCSGGDLDAMGSSTVEKFQRMEAQLEATMTALGDVTIPLIALINGACFGAGIQLALTADLRIAADDAKFGVPAAKFGLVYPSQAITGLVTLVGRAQATRILLTGRSISASEALRIGLVQETVPTAALETHGRELANGIAAVPLPALHATTALLREAAKRGAVDGVRNTHAAAYSPDYLQACLDRISVMRRK
jgi:enoyl-CoA hydratase/carnithine racemase